MSRVSNPAISGGSPERYVIPNLRNACRIMSLLSDTLGGLRITDISRNLGIPVTTAVRIMTTLEIEGYARKRGRQFELGPVLIHLGETSLAGTEICEVAIPVLRELTRKTAETSQLAIPYGDQALIVAVRESPHPLGVPSRPRILADLHCFSVGKIFLAFLHHERLQELYNCGRAARRTRHTQTTICEIHRETEYTRQRGFSLDDEESNLGIRCLAAPVLASEGLVVAAIGITASTVRLSRECIAKMAAHVQSAAHELSRLIGYHHAR